MKTRSLLAAAFVLLLCALVALWKAPSSVEALSPAATGQADRVSEPARLEMPAKLQADTARVELPVPAEKSTKLETESEPTAVVASEITSWCRVVAADSGQPVVGAKISQTGGSISLWGSPASSISATQTDHQGFAKFRLQDERHAIAQVDARDFGPVRFKVADGHETPESALEIRVSRAATLVVRITDAVSAPIARARVRLKTPVYTITRPRGEAIFDGYLNWSEETDENGSCTFTGLPGEVPLAAHATQGERSLHKEASSLILKPGERRELEWAVGSGGRLSGLLLDQFGMPVIDCELWLSRSGLNAAPHRERFYFYSGDEERVIHQSTTDERGRFSFDDVAAGQWFVGPSPNNRTSTEPLPEVVAPIATSVVMPEGSDRYDLEITAQRGLYIAGRVVTPTGDPSKNAWVLCTNDLGFFHAVLIEGAFFAGPVDSLAHNLTASSFKEYSDSKVVEAWPGQEPVLLKLQQGGTLAGRFIDASTGEECRATLTTSCVATGHWSIRFVAVSGFSESGLAPGLYNLTATTSEGLIGVLRNVEVETRGAVEGLEIRLNPGAKLWVRYTGSKEYAWYTVFSDGAQIASDSMHSGTTALETVPHGTVVVRLNLSEDVFYEREIDCVLGQDAEVEFVLE